MATGTILDRILETKRAEVARHKAHTPLAELERRIEELPSPDSFSGALWGDTVRLIAEVKKASPSRGLLSPSFDPVGLAALYAQNGAAAISVLTEVEHFQGSLEHLRAVKETVSQYRLPVLRKDFIYDPYQLYEARAHAADAALLIVAMLSRQQLEELLGEARRLWLQCLVEAHTQQELEIALEAGAEVIGINHRDLRTFDTDATLTQRLRPLIPRGKIVVAESGIFTREDVIGLGRLGVNAVLVGRPSSPPPTWRPRCESWRGRSPTTPLTPPRLLLPSRRILIREGATTAGPLPIQRFMQWRPGMVTLVVTRGPSSMDLYSQRLAAALGVPTMWSDVYRRSCERFGVSWFSFTALAALTRDLAFIARLRARGGGVHLPNHHMGRYIHLLGGPVVITVHDMIRYSDLTRGTRWIHAPNTRDRWYLRRDYAGIRRARRIIVPSHHTRKEVVAFLRVPEHRVAVVHHGIDRRVFSPADTPGPGTFPYLLCVGSEQPRKNLVVALRAFAKLKKRPRFRSLKLIKVGRAGGCEADFRGQTMEVVHSLGLARDVIFTGYIPVEELAALYRHAACFLFPSLHEGFGWPPLEAMACGAPVIASRSASIPEVVGPGGLLVDPLDVDAWADAAVAVLTDGALRERLVSDGLHWAREFTWEKAARKTLDVYAQAEEAA